MHRAKADIEQRLAADPALARKMQEVGGYRFVYDHVRYHDRAATLLNLEPWHRRVETPPWSPDFNRPVEHAFGTIKRLYKTSREPLEGPDLMQAMKDRITALTRKYITAESVRKDVEGMPLMLKVIKSSPNEIVVAPNGKVYHGVQGGWTPRELR
jgi:transposase